jgi:hypothetical protein
MVQWELHNKHPSTSFGKIVKRHIGAADADNVDRMISAYEALYKGNYKSPGDIQRSFTKYGQPLFTKEQAASIFRQIKKNQTGGERIESLVNSMASSGIDMAAGITKPPPPNAAVQGAVKSVQLFIRMIIPFVFILDTIENIPLFGDLIGASLDVTAATLPVIASNIQTFTPALVGLIPIPLAGTVGILLGWLFSLWFLWLAAVIGTSRKDFAAAVEATAGMVPVIGPALMRGVKAVETVGTKFYNRADRISTSISQAYGSLMGAVTNAKNTVSGMTSSSTGKMPSLANIAQTAKETVAIPLSAETPTPPPTTESAAEVKPENTKKESAPQGGRKGKGGKRFSTRRRNLLKCPKTRRNKCARS